jgi:uncharacterized protein (TIGR02001 family)
MKKTLLNIAFTSTLLTTSMTSFNATADEGLAGIEGLSGNAGVVSQYFFRGIAQTTSASASGGIDYEKGGFYAGTWAADVQDGIEVDFYAGYGIEVDSGINFSAGFTTYQYTGDFDSAYNEVNLSAGYGIFSISYNVGTHDEDKGLDIEEADYDFLSLTIESESGLYTTVGTWGQDFEGDYIELGYGTSIAAFDIGIALISNSEELDLETGEGEESLVFSISTSF